MPNGDNKKQEGRYEEYKKWLTSQYTPSRFQFWERYPHDILKKKPPYMTHPEEWEGDATFNYWFENIYKPQAAMTPQITVEQYKKWLTEFLQAQEDTGNITDAQRRQYLAQIMQTVRQQGINYGTPYLDKVLDFMGPAERKKIEVEYKERATETASHKEQKEILDYLQGRSTKAPSALKMQKFLENQEYITQQQERVYPWQTQAQEAAEAQRQVIAAGGQEMPPGAYEWAAKRGDIKAELGRLTEERDWIKRFELERALRQGAPPQITPWTYMSPTERGTEMTLGLQGGFGKGDPTAATPGERIGTEGLLRAGYTNLNKYLEDVERLGEGVQGPFPVKDMSVSEAWKAYHEAARGHSGKPVPTTPIAPEFLKKLVPALGKGGEWATPYHPLAYLAGRIKQVEPEEVITPSAQQFQRLTPTQRGQYAGYLDWLGQNYVQKPGVGKWGMPSAPKVKTPPSYEDVMWQMQRMLPQTPRGVRSKRYRPARQRA